VAEHSDKGDIGGKSLSAASVGPARSASGREADDSGVGGREWKASSSSASPVAAAESLVRELAEAGVCGDSPARELAEAGVGGTDPSRQKLSSRSCVELFVFPEARRRSRPIAGELGEEGANDSKSSG